MAAEKVLDVVLGGRQQYVDARFVHQPVEPRGVERRGARSLGNIEHDCLPEAHAPPCFADSLANSTGRMNPAGCPGVWHFFA